MKDFNKNNPTRGWTEDEQYDFCKKENKWVKELQRANSGTRTAGVARLATESPFSTVEQINIAFKADILQRKETWRHLCHICDFAINRKEHLTNHLGVHGIGDRFKCDKCDKDFSAKCNLQTHLKAHTLIRQKCDQCGQMYKTLASLKLHIAAMHTEKQLECGECEKMFSTIRNLNRHKRTVHIFKSFKCDQCKFRSKTNGQLKDHINQVHNGVLSKCDLCDFQGRAGNLKIHKEAVHENKKKWFCKACSYSTYHKRCFLEHMRNYTGEKPYQCKTCGSYFSNAHNATKHCKK